MKTKMLTIQTDGRQSMVEITNEVQAFVDEASLVDGVVTLFVPHTTAAVTINENTDPDVARDMLHGLTLSLPDRKEYRHAEGNSDAHIKASVIGVSETIPVVNGRLSLGTWQGIYFCEFDGPRTRKLIVSTTS